MEPDPVLAEFSKSLYEYLTQLNSTYRKKDILEMIKVLNKFMQTENSEPDYFTMLVKEMDKLNDQLEDLRPTIGRLKHLLAKVEDPNADEDFWLNYPPFTKDDLRDDIEEVKHAGLDELKYRLEVEYRDCCIRDLENFHVILEYELSTRFRSRSVIVRDETDELRPELHGAIQSRLEEIFEDPSSV